MTYTPQWVEGEPDKKGEIQLVVKMIEEPAESKYIEVTSKFKSKEKTNREYDIMFRRRIKLSLTDHFPAPKGVPYNFALPIEGSELNPGVDPDDLEEVKEE